MAVAEAKSRRFNVTEYYRMAETGVLRPDERVELIEGEIVEMAPIGNRHAACVTLLHTLLLQAKPDVIVRCQNPLRIDDRSEPEPDLLIARRKGDFYSSGHPGPDDALLVIEVSETTLSFDREVKLPLYARAAIPEVWIVDLQNRRVLVHRRPGADGFEVEEIAGPGDRIASETISGIDLAVDDFLV